MAQYDYAASNMPHILAKVVLCRDCEHLLSYPDASYCNRTSAFFEVSDDDFCAWGKLKEGGTMARQFEQYSAYTPVPTTVSATTWGGWQAINPKCWGCKHHFLCGTASMCSCASRTTIRGMDGDTCASYLGKGL